MPFVATFLLGLLCAILILKVFARQTGRAFLTRSRRLKTASGSLPKQDIRLMIKDLTNLAHDHPELIAPYLLLAHLYRLDGDIARSTALHQRLLARQDLPKDVFDRVNFELIQDLVEAGIEEQTSELVKNFKQKSGYYYRALTLLAEAHRAKKDWDKAYESAAALEARQSTGQSRKAAAYLKAVHAKELLEQDHLPEAKKAAKRSLGHDRGCVLAHLVLGDVALAEHQFDEAIKVFSRLVKLNPAYSFVTLPRLEDAYFRKKAFTHFGLALENLTQAVRNEDYFLPYTLGRFLRKKKQFDDAEKELRRSLDINPNFRPARLELGQLYLESTRTDDALDDYSGLLKELADHDSYSCQNCGALYESMTWRCESCGEWESVRLNFPQETPRADSPFHRAS